MFMMQEQDLDRYTERSKKILQLESQTQKLKPYVHNDFYSQKQNRKLKQIQSNDAEFLKRQQIRPLCFITNEPISKEKLFVADCLQRLILMR